MEDSRQVTFKCNNLGENVQLVLCFMPRVPGLFEKRFSIVWKVANLPAQGGIKIPVTWTDTMAFSAAQIDANSIVTSNTYIHIKPGQSTTLVMKEAGLQASVYEFSDPRFMSHVDVMQVINGTHGPAHIGIGFITKKGTMDETIHTAMVYPALGDELAILANFTPVLRAYVALNDIAYTEGQMLRADVQYVKPVWCGDLRALKAETTVVIKKNVRGGYESLTVNADCTDESQSADSSAPSRL